MTTEHVMFRSSVEFVVIGSVLFFETFSLFIILTDSKDLRECLYHK